MPKLIIRRSIKKMALGSSEPSDIIMLTDIKNICNRVSIKSVLTDCFESDNYFLFAQLIEQGRVTAYDIKDALLVAVEREKIPFIKKMLFDYRFHIPEAFHLAISTSTIEIIGIFLAAEYPHDHKSIQMMRSRFGPNVLIN